MTPGDVSWKEYMDSKFLAMEKFSTAQVLSVEEATKIAKSEMLVRLEHLNNTYAMLKDQAATLATKLEVDNLRERLNQTATHGEVAAIKDLVENGVTRPECDARETQHRSDIGKLQIWQAAIDGKASQQDVDRVDRRAGNANIIAIWGVILAGLAIIASIVQLFRL